MDRRTGRRKTGRTKKEVEQTKEAYNQLSDGLIKKLPTNDGKEFLDREVSPVLMQWLDEMKAKAEAVMLQDHLNG